MSAPEGAYHDDQRLEKARPVTYVRPPEEPIRLADMAPEVLTYLRGVFAGLRAESGASIIGFVRYIALERLLYKESEVSRDSLLDIVRVLNTSLALELSEADIDDAVTQVWSDFQHYATGGVGDPTDDSLPQ